MCVCIGAGQGWLRHHYAHGGQDAGPGSLEYRPLSPVEIFRGWLWRGTDPQFCHVVDHVDEAETLLRWQDRMVSGQVKVENTVVLKGG